MKSENITITVEKCKDSSLALVLISLICYQAWKSPFLILLAIAFLLVAMTYPPLFRPFAWFRFTFSTLLGTVVSKIILIVLFFVVVCPVALVRRALGKDSMQMTRWKKDVPSAFRVREHCFYAKDLDHHY